MHNNELVPTEIRFKKFLLDTLITFRNQGNINQSYIDEKELLLEELKNKIGDLPQMDAEETNEFFSTIFTEILRKLDEFYEIEVEPIDNDNCLSSRYHLRIKEHLDNIVADFEKYSKSARFMEGFLNTRSYNLYNTASSLRYTLNSFRNAEKKEKGALTLRPYNIHTKDDIPTKRMSFTAMRDVYGEMHSHRTGLKRLVNEHEEFMRHVDMYVEESREIMRREHVKFSAKYLKEVLSRIIVPVSLLEDEALQKACEEQGREVFVFKPETSDFLFDGAQVHVYSKHDLEDDLGYKIAPLTLDATLPADTEEYKYHGIGTYTRYDTESKRSMNGQIPHVIGDVLYCGADMEEFMSIIPEELLEEIRICEEISASVGSEERCEVKENSVIRKLVKELKEEVQEEVTDIVNGFMNLSTSRESESNETDFDCEIDLDNASVDDIYGKDFARQLLSIHERHPNGYAILQDVDGHYYGVSISNGDKVVTEITNTDGVNGVQDAFERCCRELNLTAGLYPVYKFERGRSSKSEAVLGMKYFGGME